MKLLIVRPQPGADETARRAAALGVETIVSPIFVVAPIDWIAPDPTDIDAVAITSANAARLAGEQLAPFRRLTCYAVGEASAEAATAAGFAEVRTGSGDGGALIAMIARDGIVRLLRLRGRDARALAHPGVGLVERIVYQSEPVAELPTLARAALGTGTVTMIHSPRAATLFAALVDRAAIDRATLSLAAISAAAADAAGPGWRRVESAALPRDPALLELAVMMCQNTHDRDGTCG